MIIELHPSKNKNFKELLEEKQIYIEAPCGGIGKCGKCKIRILSGKTQPLPDEKGFVRACLTKPESMCEVFIPENQLDSKSYEFVEITNNHNTASEGNYAICDIGTTNIKIREYAKGKIAGVHFFRNPQFSFGGDVISRIANCKNDGYITQCKLVREAIASRINHVDTAYICGNPTMIHIFACVDPSPIGVYPFECVFKETKLLSAEETRLGFDSVLLPSASAYVGSDAITGVAMLWEKDKNILIADLGTNGEISLIKNGKVYSATTAAGPAIEGANMEMGVCSNNDVVVFVDENGNPKINGNKAAGINAGGVFSLISYLLKTNQLSSEGRLVDISSERNGESSEPFANMNKLSLSKIVNNKFYITEDVYLSQNDISEFMLAKSAVKTAIILLLKETDTNFTQIDKFVLTGGLSTELSVEIFSDIGLIPKELKEKAVHIPDLAITATEKCTNKEFMEFVEELALNVETLSLSDNESFEEEFVINTFFD